MSAPDLYADPLGRVLRHALVYLDGLEAAPVSATVTYDDLHARLARPLPEEGTHAAEVIDQLVTDVEGGLVGSAGGRFYAWVIGGTLPAALGADWLTSAWDQNAGLYVTAPAAAVIEEVCGTWLKQLLGVPETASFALVTGCQMAHVTCLAAARNALLSQRGWHVESQGMAGAPAVRIVGSDQMHGTVGRAARLLGIGTDNVIGLESGTSGAIDRSTLQRWFENADDAPTIVLLQAGDINTGAYDPFAELIPVAHEYDAWVHVDGAIGLWAAVSSRHRGFLDGAEAADSWATDGHKWLNVPYDCGYAFVAHAEPHRASMSHRASYLTHASVGRDQMDWNPEWSRRNRAIATYAAIRQLGRTGIADLVERCCGHARALATRIGTLPGAELLWEPMINQGLVRFIDGRPDAKPEDHDRRTDEVIASIVSEGEAFFSGTTWNGRRCMRISVSSWQTTSSDVQRAVEAVQRALA